MGLFRARRADRPIGTAPQYRLALLAACAVFAAVLIPATFAFAGQASDGKLVFYPCTDCHPVSVNAAGVPSHKLPSDFKGHNIVLESHDILGKGEAACTVCHQPGTKNPGLVLTVDGTYVDVKTGDISKVCQRCHFEKYQQFVQGVHGKNQKSCTAANCHDPHTPGYFNVPPLEPFLGTGVQVRIFPTRTEFTPFPGPPPPPAVYTPVWYGYLALALYALAAVIAGGLIVTIVRGRQKA